MQIQLSDLEYVVFPYYKQEKKVQEISLSMLFDRILTLRERLHQTSVKPEGKISGSWKNREQNLLWYEISQRIMLAEFSICYKLILI